MTEVIYRSLTVQIHLENPESIGRVKDDLGVLLFDVDPAIAQHVVGPFPGFHESAFTIMVIPHGCKSKHTDIVDAHEKLISRLRDLAGKWDSEGSIMTDCIEWAINSDNPELIDIRVDPLEGWNLEAQRVSLSQPKADPATDSGGYPDDRVITLPDFTQYLTEKVMDFVVIEGKDSDGEGHIKLVNFRIPRVGHYTVKFENDELQNGWGGYDKVYLMMSA